MLSQVYFPGAPVTAESMGIAYAREENYWERMKYAVAQGIALAFGEG